MDFDEHDDGDEEMTPMPVSSSYDAPMQPGLGLGGGGGGGTPKHGDSGGGSFRTPPHGFGGGSAGVGGGGGGGTRYRECLKNHAVGIGGHAVDGCGEFMAAGEEGSIDALRCAACGCHRNFHRKESDSPTGGGVAPADAAALSPAAITAYGAAAHHHHHQFSPYYRTPAGYLLHPHQQLAAAHMQMQQRPLALPSTSHSGRDEGDDMSGLIGPMVVAPMVGMSLGSGGPSGSGGGGSGSGKKRFRTKFTQEQKDRMLAFAERLGWRIQKHDEAAVQQFCEEVCVKRHVLKVWMHNNKHTLGKKP